MSLNINGKEIGRKELFILIGCLVVLVAVMVLSVISYSDKQSQTNAVKQQETVAQQQRDKLAADAQAAKEAQREADMTKLISICMEAQQGYDAMTAKQQALQTRPDCTASVQ